MGVIIYAVIGQNLKFIKCLSESFIYFFQLDSQILENSLDLKKNKQTKNHIGIGT